MMTSLQKDCIRCGGRLTSPQRCSLDEEFVCYVWLCPKCGCEFEASTCLYQDETMTPQLVETFLSNLLVA
jgi:hypothetical protein